MHAFGASRIVDRDGVQTAGTTLEERVFDLEPALRASAGFDPKPRIQRERVGVVGAGVMFHIRIWERIPPTRNAPTHVPNHTIIASFVPRSLSMTISDAMHGTKSVIVTNATTI